DRPIVRVYVPSSNLMFKFTPQQWRLIQLFDGQKSYEEIAEVYSQQNNIEYDAEEVREFGAELEAVQFWYKTPQERNILLMQQTAEERRKKMQQRSRWADLSVVTFPAFNPDKFLTGLYSHTRFIYTLWFTTLTLIAFALTAFISVTHWSEIGRDTFEFYKFANKTVGDIVVLYFIILAIVTVHEFAHAYVSKHFGARVTAMGFALVYLTPCFYTDTTEAEVLTSRYERFVVTIAGVWSELMICAIATFIWWGTPPDTPLHNGAYIVMMLTGFMSIIMNWNPLMKLDGYHMLCDMIGISDLKENSTAYVSSWVKKFIWRLPVEVPYVPTRRRLGYAMYALLSGAYSYLVLYLVARFAGNVVRNFDPEWGFIPELAVAGLIFRSRIRLLVNFMKFVYLDKKDRIRAWFTPRHSMAVVALAVTFLALPLWHDSISGRFMLEPLQTAIIRARVPGMVTQLFVDEGQQVAAGQPLAVLRNLPLRSEFEEAGARLSAATERANAASLHYTGYGSALKDREQFAAQTRELSNRNAELQISSPISGIVVTPRVRDLTGSYLTEGSTLLQVADLSELRARIYVSEYDVHKTQMGSQAKLQVQGVLKKWHARIVSVAPSPTEMDSNLLANAELKGMNPPHFYLVDLVLQNPDLALKPGMIGIARVYGKRRSLLGLGKDMFSDFWGRKLW
ncbi:MAG: efflux RND transporter periplasmic adaptor subunit, partial [Candidatus Acidiferrum sp.]